MAGRFARGVRVRVRGLVAWFLFWSVLSWGACGARGRPVWDDDDPARALPEFVGAVRPGAGSLRWSGPCAGDSTVSVTLEEGSSSPSSSSYLEMEWAFEGAGGAAGGGCAGDVVVVATMNRALVRLVGVGHGWRERVAVAGKGEARYLRAEGVRVFLLPAGLVGTAGALVSFLPLFADAEGSEGANVRFLERHMGARFDAVEFDTPSDDAEVADGVESGDILVISKVRGPWGGFETVEKWVSGSYGGHAAVALWAPDGGGLHVVESGKDDDERPGLQVIGVTPWAEWMARNRGDAEADPHVALLKLNVQFDAEAAWQYVQEMKGRSYGYHNMIFAWIDTPNDNFPPPVDAHVMEATMEIWGRLQPEYMGRLWVEGLNHRLGTQNLSMPEVRAEAARRGLGFGELLAIPEQDDWEYPYAPYPGSGPSFGCVQFVVSVLKAGGIFGDLEVQATEFTVRDAYQLAVWSDDPGRLPKACQAQGRPYCQLMGRYRMDLPGFNTVRMYAHMNERCPSLPPDYVRPDGC